jgi:hypothetical protein
MLSLETLCIRHIANRNINNLNEKLNQPCYDKIIDFQISKGFDNWKQQMELTSIELNIKEMDVSYDMHFDVPCHFIFIKYRSHPNDFDDELYRDEYDSPLYYLYYEIAKNRGLIQEEQFNYQ